ncbi:hypothetical protein CEQ90_11875 [Lewinellaceae bacterium SD302]|nr:hypothetical protein CEQ90_11875 [Lewinellaceae bacterium SD302]
MYIDFKRALIFIIVIFSSATLFAQRADLSGKVTAINDGQPLVGATVSLADGENVIRYGETTDEYGRYVFDQIKAGRYELTISYVGYLTYVESGYLVGSGPATNRNFELQLNPDPTIEAIEITAVRNTSVVNPLKRQVKLEEVRRLPATFYDPARLLALSPGVAQTNDQANHLSVRGNSPNRNLWRLQGLAIVNPNHTANAGTINDQPTLSGGGVNALSAQLLDNSTFYAGGLPAAYGNATAGTFDMRLRPGNTERRQHQVQAGFIGFDLATEGPFAKGNPNSGSYLVNYRYSFTGLLADFGADFGGEEIRFQDFSAHLFQPLGKSGELSVFGLYGASSNEFTGNVEEPEEEKDLSNIDFQSNVLITGATFKQRIGVGLLSVGFAYSETNNDREEEWLNFDPPVTVNRPLDQRRISSQFAYTFANESGASFSIGNEFLSEATDINLLFGTGPAFTGSQNITSPFLRAEKRFGDLALSGGLRYSVYLDLAESNVLEPRMLISYYINRSTLSLSAERSSRLPTEVIALLTEEEYSSDFVPVSNLVNLGWQTDFENGNTLRSNAFFQDTPDDFSSQSTRIFRNDFLDILSGGTTRSFNSRSYGFELSYARPIKPDALYYSANLSIFRSENQNQDGEWLANRFSRDFIFQGLSGKEWSGNNKRGKRRTFGANLSIILAGGERFYPIMIDDNSISGFTTDFSDGRSDQLSTYVRPDLRLYRRKYHKKTTTTLSLDIQNLSGIENTAYRYYDSVTEQVEDRKQLGLIPVLSYRVEWR